MLEKKYEFVRLARPILSDNFDSALTVSEVSYSYDHTAKGPAICEIVSRAAAPATIGVASKKDRLRRVSGFEFGKNFTSWSSGLPE